MKAIEDTQLTRSQTTHISTIPNQHELLQKIKPQRKITLYSAHKRVIGPQNIIKQPRFMIYGNFRNKLTLLVHGLTPRRKKPRPKWNINVPMEFCHCFLSFSLIKSSVIQAKQQFHPQIKLIFFIQTYSFLKNTSMLLQTFLQTHTIPPNSHSATSKTRVVEYDL